MARRCLALPCSSSFSALVLLTSFGRRRRRRLPRRCGRCSAGTRSATHLRHRKTYAALIANRASLGTLLELRATRQGEAPSAIAALRANLVGDMHDDPGFRAARYTVWGDQAERQQGEKLIAAAPEDPRPLYEEIFNDKRR